MIGIFSDQKGMAALISVIVIFVVVLGAGITISAIAINELSLDLEAAESNQALQIAESCADEASFRLKRDSGYTGGTLSFTKGDCTITITGTGSSRAVTASATVKNTTREVLMDISLTSHTSTTAEGSDIIDWDEN